MNSKRTCHQYAAAEQFAAFSGSLSILRQFKNPHENPQNNIIPNYTAAV
jgi:hypothetical protein